MPFFNPGQNTVQWILGLRTVGYIYSGSSVCGLSVIYTVDPRFADCRLYIQWNLGLRTVGHLTGKVTSPLTSRLLSHK